MEETARHFNVRKVSADKAYLSRDNLELVARLDALPYVPFKEGTTGRGGGMWEKMWHVFQYRRLDWLDQYHKRSNVESTFSSIKRKFGDSLRSKTKAAAINEA